LNGNFSTFFSAYSKDLKIESSQGPVFIIATFFILFLNPSNNLLNLSYLNINLMILILAIILILILIVIKKTLCQK